MDPIVPILPVLFSFYQEIRMNLGGKMRFCAKTIDSYVEPKWFKKTSNNGVNEAAEKRTS